MILLAALIYLAKIIGGLALTHLIWDSREPRHIFFKLFLGTGVGFGISSLLYFAWFTVGLPGTLYPYLEFFLFLTVLTISLIREFKRKNNKTHAPWKMPETPTFIWLGLSLLTVAISSASFWLYAAKNPHGYNDAWAIWNSAARFIYLAGDHWLSLLPKDAWYHADYPLMLSLNVAEGWSILGVDSTRIPMMVAFIFFLSMIGLLFSSVSTTKDIEQGALTALVVASLSQVPFLSAWQYADVPLSYFFLATAALFYLYSMLGDTRLLILTGLFAAFAAWTKNEGVNFALISLLLCLALSIRQKKNLLKYFGMGALVPALLIGFFKTLTPANDLFVDRAKSIAQLFDITRYQIILSKLTEFSLSFGGWAVSFAVILVCYMLLIFTKPKLKGKLWLPIALCAAQLAGYFVIYLITPHDLILHLNTSLERLLFHLFPLTMFIIFTTLPSPREIFSAKESTGE